jgi:hypothetical protein
VIRSCAVGIRVKSGWASAILVGLDRGRPQYVHRGRLLLADPKVPKSAQPYHRGFSRLQKDPATIAHLTAVVHKVASRSLAAFLGECKRQGHSPQVLALVVGSTIDPATVSNEHIRAHAYEGQLFRSALERAAGRLGLRPTIMRERDVPQRVTIGHRMGIRRAWGTPVARRVSIQRQQ